MEAQPPLHTNYPDGVVCAVAFSGAQRGEQWPGSRVISAQKANTANAFSLPDFALSTANLFSAVQPGNSLFGLQHSNPVYPQVAYGGNSTHYGLHNDFMTGKKIAGHTTSAKGFGHPPFSATATTIANQLPVTHPVGSH